jgi:hypothetical protein
VVEFTDDAIRVAFPNDAAFHRSQVMGQSRALIEKELTQALGRNVKLSEATNAGALEAAPRSIAEEEATSKAARSSSIEKKVREHPSVKLILKHLGGSIEHVQILEPAPAEAEAPTIDTDSPSEPS